MKDQVVVTGGSGFIGAYLVKRLVKDGWKVHVIDNMARGEISRLEEVKEDIEIFNIDIRSQKEVERVIRKSSLVIHLAAINGTENFYKKPELVLDVGIKGALSVVEACIKVDVPDLIIASSAEVYQTPKTVPTPEDIPLMIPDSLNPRYSYGGSKLISEIIAFNYGINHFRKLQVFRPHNIYGPDMGWKHVIPQFILRANSLTSSVDKSSNDVIFPIQGEGDETRAFCYVDDVVDGIMKMYKYGDHRAIYHIGNDQEINIKFLVNELSKLYKKNFIIQPSPSFMGGTPRRCPDIKKMRALGYIPKVDLIQGLKLTNNWYLENIDKIPSNHLL